MVHVTEVAKLYPNATYKWYVLYVKSRHEKKVEERLNDKNIENYLPVQRTLKQWKDRKKYVIEPIFKSYIFVNVCEQEYEIIRQIDGVVNFVYWLGKPAIIRDKEILDIKDFFIKYQNFEIREIPRLGDNVQVQYGSFKNIFGKVVKVNKQKVKLILEMLNIEITAWIDLKNIKVEN